MEMNRARALEILELDEAATNDDIEKRYSVLLKRNDQLKRGEGSLGEGFESAFNLQTQAYSFLRGVYVTNPEVQEKKKDRLDLKNFWYYYRYFIIIGTITVAFFGYIIADAYFRAKPDIRVMLAGEIYGIATDNLEKAIQKGAPDLGIIQANIVSYKEDPSIPDMLTNREKIFLEMTMGKDDIVILDQPLFKRYVEADLFVRLDELLADTPGGQALLNSNKVIRAKSINDETEHVYGIDVSGEEIFIDNDIIGDVLIIAVRTKEEINENVYEFISYLTGFDLKAE